MNAQSSGRGFPLHGNARDLTTDAPETADGDADGTTGCRPRTLCFVEGRHNWQALALRVTVPRRLPLSSLSLLFPPPSLPPPSLQGLPAPGWAGLDGMGLGQAGCEDQGAPER